MSKFCRSCGHALEEGATACPACGKPTSQEVAVKKKNNDVLSKISEIILVIFCLVEKLLLLLVSKIGSAIKNAGKNQPASNGSQGNALRNDSKLNVVRLAIVVVLIVVALIGAIMNLTLKYEVEATVRASFGGEELKTSASGPIGDLAESDDFIGLIIVNILWAVFNIVLVIMGILLTLKVLKLTNSDKKFKSLALTGLIGDVLYIILYLICGSVSTEVMGMTAKYSVSLHFFAWIHVVLFALAFASNFVNLNAVTAASNRASAE